MHDICLSTYYLYEMPSRKEKQFFTSTPLGVLALGASVREAGLDAKIVDVNEIEVAPRPSSDGQDDVPQAAASQLAETDAQLFGLSTICSSFPITLQTAVALKQLRPDATIVLGGPQASAVAVEVMEEFPVIDFVLRGEADLTLPALIETLGSRRRRGLASIPGLVYRSRSGEPRASATPPSAPDLDDLPVPAYDLWHPRGEFGLAVEAGRGCPFRCTFCSTSGFFGHKNRRKSPARLLHETELLASKYGTKAVAFVVNELASDRAWLMETCERLKNSPGGPFEWGCAVRADSVDDELLAAMKEAGCLGVFFGIEAGSERLQKVVRKRLPLDKIPRLAEVCDGLGLRATFSFITGFPEEREDDLRATTQLMLDVYRYPSSKLRLGLLSPLSGSDIERKYRGQLLFDYIPSSFLSPGMALDDQTLAMVRAIPRLFPDYYGVPTEQIGRNVAYELQCFCAFLLPYFRWPCIALHQSGISLYDLFREWLEQRTLTVSRIDQLGGYYWSFETRRNFRDLLTALTAQRVPELADAMTTLLAAMVYDEREVDTMMSTQGASPGRAMRTTDIPALAPGLVFRACPGDYRGIIQRLARAEPLDSAASTPTGVLFSFAPAGTSKRGRSPLSHGLVKREVVSPFKRALIVECDGAKSVAEVADQLAGGFECAPTRRHVVFAIQHLAKAGILVSGRDGDAKPTLRVKELDDQVVGTDEIAMAMGIRPGGDQRDV